MNINENIIIFEKTDSQMFTFLHMNNIEYKKLGGRENKEYILVPKKHEVEIKRMLADLNVDRYFISWSDRYTERHYLNDQLVVGMGILKAVEENETWLFKDNENFYGFGG